MRSFLIATILAGSLAFAHSAAAQWVYVHHKAGPMATYKTFAYVSDPKHFNGSLVLNYTDKIFSILLPDDTLDCSSPCHISVIFDKSDSVLDFSVHTRKGDPDNIVYIADYLAMGNRISTSKSMTILVPTKRELIYGMDFNVSDLNVDRLRELDSRP